MSAPSGAGPQGAAEAAAAPIDPIEPAEPIEPTNGEVARRGRHGRAGMIVAIVLGVLMLGVAAFAAWLFLQLDEANAHIEKQDRQIEKQRDLIERKEVFGAAMNRLYDSLEPLQGLPFASMVDWDRYQAIATAGWFHRWDKQALGRDTGRAIAAANELEQRQTAAQAEALGNVSGSAWESTLDRLGHGYVSTRIEDAQTFCDGDVLACVADDDPYIVHVDAVNGFADSMTDWIRTGVAYHEFAHVLQDTNPEPTEAAVKAFGGDVETMADCYALTMLDGWTLDHEVWTGPYTYWEVSVGYGYVCDDTQRQVIRDWSAQVGVVLRPLTQDGSGRTAT